MMTANKKSILYGCHCCLYIERYDCLRRVSYYQNMNVHKCKYRVCLWYRFSHHARSLVFFHITLVNVFFFVYFIEIFFLF